VQLLAAAQEGQPWKEAEAEFEEVMRTNAIEYIAADEDESGVLDFDEFCVLVRELEEADDISLRELRQRFNELDANKNGFIDRHEFIQYSLYESLSRSAGRVVDLFKRIDRDGSNSVDKREFRKAIRALGFSADFYRTADVDAVFDALDEDGGGCIDLLELTKKLKPSTVATNKHRLRKRTEGKRGQALAAHNKLTATDGHGATEQLSQLLIANRVRMIDLFRSWDEDGNGLIDKGEFSRALRVLGLDAPEATIKALFASWDKDDSGVLEFKELNRILKHGAAHSGPQTAAPSAAAGTAPAHRGMAAGTKVVPKMAAVSEALDSLRAGSAERTSRLATLSGRAHALECTAQAKRERAAAGHASLLQRQLVDAMRSPSVLTRVPAASARGPPVGLPGLESYLQRPTTARTPPPAAKLLHPAVARA